MISWLLLFTAVPSFAAERATVILLRGVAKTDQGRVLSLKDSVDPGTTIQTEAKSFVKLLFTDQTQMNIGPSSTLKIEATRPGEVNLVNLVAGQIRAKVNRDPLVPVAPRKDKLVIKTRTAAMGIRGTDFSVSYNPANQVTALLTFEGHVAMANLGVNEHSLRVLGSEARLQHVGPGQYAGSRPEERVPSVPVKISPVQLAALAGNESFRGLGERPTPDAPAAGPAPVAASPIPPGVDPRAFSADPKFNALPVPNVNDPTFKPAPAEGQLGANTYAPRAGGYLDLASGRYLPPPPGSAFDPNTATFTPPKALGDIDRGTGMYVPPKGLELDPVKGFVPVDGRAPSSEGPSAAKLNAATDAKLAGKTAYFERTFAPAGEPGRLPASAPAALPEIDPRLPHPPREPVDDPFCPLCVRDNIEATRGQTRVRFLITAQ